MKSCRRRELEAGSGTIEVRGLGAAEEGLVAVPAEAWPLVVATHGRHATVSAAEAAGAGVTANPSIHLLR